jgi:acetyl esterase/lipase
LIDLFEVVVPAWENLAAISCPVLLIAGDHDPAAAMGAQAYNLATALGQSGVRVDLTLYDGGSRPTPEARVSQCVSPKRDLVGPAVGRDDGRRAAGRVVA